MAAWVCRLPSASLNFLGLQGRLGGSPQPSFLHWGLALSRPPRVPALFSHRQSSGKLDLTLACSSENLDKQFENCL